MDNEEKKVNTDKEPKSRFKSGSIFERWAEDENDFIKCFSQKKDTNENNKNDNN